MYYATYASPSSLRSMLGTRRKDIHECVLCACARQVLEPKLEEEGLQWEDVRESIERLLADEKMIKNAIRQPKPFLKKLLFEAKLLILLAVLRKSIEPKLPFPIEWPDGKLPVEWSDGYGHSWRRDRNELRMRW